MLRHVPELNQALFFYSSANIPRFPLQLAISVGELVRNIVIDIWDGLAVPFALAPAGVSQTISASAQIVLEGYLPVSACQFCQRRKSRADSMLSAV